MSTIAPDPIVILAGTVLRFTKDGSRLRRQRYVAVSGPGFYEIESYGTRWFVRYCRCATRRIGPGDGFVSIERAMNAAAVDEDRTHDVSAWITAASICETTSAAPHVGTPYAPAKTSDRTADSTGRWA